MKKIIMACSVYICIYACSQSKSEPISIGSVTTLHSDILKEDRKIWVHMPDTTGGQKFPVVYLLDGDAHFYSVMGMIHNLSEINGNMICPRMIVVGIPNTDRTRDLTPTHSTFLPGRDGGDFLKTSGGGENFTAFIQKELMPFIDSHYPTAPYKLLIGHSFGGLTAVNILINHPDMFNAYVVIDPSLWWDGQKLLNQSKSVLEQNKFHDKSVFLAIANTMDPGLDTTKVVSDTSQNSIHIRSILQFAKLLDANKSNGLEHSWKYYNDDGHGSVPMIAEYDALHFLFPYYRIPQTPDIKITPAYLKEHYQKVSEKMGFKNLPPESIVNQLGYGALGSKSWEDAYAFFKMNIDNYPGSSNVYDSMGDYYVAKEDKPKAIEYFTKALAIKNLPETKTKLDKLKK